MMSSDIWPSVAICPPLAGNSWRINYPATTCYFVFPSHDTRRLCRKTTRVMVRQGFVAWLVVADLILMPSTLAPSSQQVFHLAEIITTNGRSSQVFRISPTMGSHHEGACDFARCGLGIVNSASDLHCLP